MNSQLKIEVLCRFVLVVVFWYVLDLYLCFKNNYNIFIKINNFLLCTHSTGDPMSKTLDLPCFQLNYYQNLKCLRMFCNHRSVLYRSIVYILEFFES